MRNLKYLIAAFAFAAVSFTVRAEVISIPSSFNIGGIAMWKSNSSVPAQHYEVPTINDFHEARVQFELNFQFTSDNTLKILNFGSMNNNYSLSISQIGNAKYLIAERILDDLVIQKCKDCKPEKIITRLQSKEDNKHLIVLNVSRDDSKSFLQIDQEHFQFLQQTNHTINQDFTPYLDYGNLSSYKFKTAEEINILNLQSGTSRNEIAFSGSNLRLIFFFISIFMFLQIHFPIRKRTHLHS